MQAPLAHWSLSWPLLAGYALVAAVHLAGLRRLLAAGDGPRAARLREAAAFHAGLLAVLAALVSPVGYWSATYMWVRGLQDLLLALAGPGLIVLGAPGQPLRAGWPGGPGAAAADGEAARPARPAWPLATAVAFNAAWIGWHLPAAYDASRSGPLAWLEYLCYLTAGLLFWRQLIGSRPARPAAGPLARFGLVAGTVVTGTVLGMALSFSASAMYPGYAAGASPVMTLLDDQQLTGAVLWMGMLPPLVIAGIALMAQLLSDDDSADLSAGLDRLLRPRRSSWPSRPGLR